MEKINVIVTAGGTNERIDEVRKITNMSTGALGVKIAEEILKQQEGKINKIYYITSKHSKQPFEHDKIKVIHTESVQEMASEIEYLLITETIHYFVHSAAISDYKTDYVTNASLLAERIELAVDSYLGRLQHGTNFEKENVIQNKRPYDCVETHRKNHFLIGNIGKK